MLAHALSTLRLRLACRFLTDAEEVNRLLIMGRDCLDQAVEKARCFVSVLLVQHGPLIPCCFRLQFMQQRQKIIEDEERALREGRRPPGGMPQ